MHILAYGNANPIFEANKWLTAGGATNGDFDRFFIEWGPDQDTTFRFIPQSAGSVKTNARLDRNHKLDFNDPYYDNKARYLANLNLLDNYENFIRVDGSSEPIPDRVAKGSNPYGSGKKNLYLNCCQVGSLTSN